MRTFVIYILLVVIAVSGCASSKGESYVRTGFDFSRVRQVAIVEVTGAIRGEVVKNQVASFFEMELLKKGYAPIERASVQNLLEEQKFQASDITTTQDAAKAGEILNVPAVILVNITEADEDISMNGKMVDVQTGEILWSGYGSGSTGKTLATIVGVAAGAAAGAAVGGDSDEQLAGAIIGGILGGVAGHALSPKEAEQVKKVITKVCENLPIIYQMGPSPPPR